MKRTFISTTGFDRMWDRMGLGDDELRELQMLLLLNPDEGDVIPGLSGVRKVRIPLERKGKSGGGRVIYVDIVVRKQIYLLLAYPKNVQEDLTSEQKKMLKKLVDTIKEE